MIQPISRTGSITPVPGRSPPSREPKWVFAAVSKGGVYVVRASRDGVVRYYSTATPRLWVNDRSSPLVNTYRWRAAASQTAGWLKTQPGLWPKL